VMKTDIMHLKHFSLPFHFLTGYFVACLLFEKQKDLYQVLFKTIFFVFHIVFIYNSMIWGQVDTISACFMFLAVVYGFWQKPFLALFWTLLAINMKLQAVIIVPIVILLCAPSLSQAKKWPYLVFRIGCLVAAQCLLLMPFILAGNVYEVWRVAVQSVGKFPAVSFNAFNLWELILWEHTDVLSNLADDTVVFGMSYKQWGLAFFFTLSAGLLWPIARWSFLNVKKETTNPLRLEVVLLASALVCLIFFYVNTQMHERYSHPAFVFLITYGLVSGRFWATIPCSLAYLLNMEAVITYFDLDNYSTLIFDRRFIAVLYTLGMLLLIADYRRLLKEV
jgi:Gpi18-like mannosyltransferase